ncbi:protein of unknown function [Cyanobium sp. NIES-981]|nr:protein of unknown function [Cyanobium sp. NIES-981]
MSVKVTVVYIVSILKNSTAVTIPCNKTKAIRA